jgi:hypothetical protein
MSRTARPVWAYLARLTGDRRHADDLLQETFYRFLRSRTHFENDDHRRRYLFRIATNLARDHRRDPRTTRHVSAEASAAELESLTERESTAPESRIDLTRAMNRPEAARARPALACLRAGLVACGDRRLARPSHGKSEGAALAGAAAAARGAARHCAAVRTGAMTRRGCPRESDVLDAVLRDGAFGGGITDTGAAGDSGVTEGMRRDELQRHVADCATCREVTEVITMLRRDRAQMEEHASVPAAGADLVALRRARAYGSGAGGRSPGQLGTGGDGGDAVRGRVRRLVLTWPSLRRVVGLAGGRLLGRSRQQRPAGVTADGRRGWNGACRSHSG